MHSHYCTLGCFKKKRLKKNIPINWHKYSEILLEDNNNFLSFGVTRIHLQFPWYFIFCKFGIGIHTYPHLLLLTSCYSVRYFPLIIFTFIRQKMQRNIQAALCMKFSWGTKIKLIIPVALLDIRAWCGIGKNYIKRALYFQYDWFIDDVMIP